MMDDWTQEWVGIYHTMVQIKSFQEQLLNSSLQNTKIWKPQQSISKI